jgi:hypothetical protein
MAISGHKSLAEVERYTKAAEQKLMAEWAIARTVTHAETPLTHGRKKRYLPIC